MKKVMIIALVIVGLLFVPAVSAELLEQTVSGSQEYITESGNFVGTSIGSMSFYNIENYQGLESIFFRADGISETSKAILASSSYYENGVTLKVDSDIIAEGTAYYNALWTDGSVTGYQCWIEFDWFDPGTKTGTKMVTLTADSGTLWNNIVVNETRSGVSATSDNPIVFRMASWPNAYIAGGSYSYILNTVWYNEINPTDNYLYLNRSIDGTVYLSDLTITDKSGTIGDSSHGDIKMLVFPPYTWTIKTPYGKTFSGTFGDGGDTPTDTAVIVYVRNSQTGALLANADLIISANVDGNFHEIVNETVPSGIYSIDLQPTGGGLPNPDFYRLWVTLDGYNSQMAYMDFEVSGGTSVYVYMEPTGEPPVDENMTFVEFYVRDIYANPLANADVNCGGYTLKTNSAGYTQFELPKNAVYSYSVSKTGYMTIEGIATVENDGRYTVNVALMAGVVPTQTVVTPTITVEPTPTQTTPPIQEDNIIGLSVKGLAKGFGIDYDTALLMFGLMIIFGAGGMVMSSVKGGAMEFIAGSIVGTFVAFALGLIPIWIFIIIAVVFGAYVLRVFVQGGQ